MPEISNVTLTGETMRYVSESLHNIADIWLHEGAKNALGRALYEAGKHQSARWLIEQAAKRVDDPRLATSIGGLALRGPTGLAAGHDKLGHNIQAWQAAGANFLIDGAVTWDGQPGNPMPRLHKFDKRFRDYGMDAGLNAMGFNGPGREVFIENIDEQRETAPLEIPLFIQVTVNKELYDERNRHMIPQRIVDTVKYVLPWADGISLGLTSPNTLGMRDAQAEDFLYEIIMPVREVVGDKPLEYKADGDGGEERNEIVCRVIDRTGIDIVSAINSTALAKIKAKYGVEHLPGGLSGGDSDYQDLSVETVRFFYEALGDKVDIIGTGGIAGPDRDEQAVRLVRAGASGLAKVTDIPRSLLRTATNTDRAVLTHLEEQQARQGKVVYLKDIIGADTKRGPKSLAA